VVVVNGRTTQQQQRQLVSGSLLSGVVCLLPHLSLSFLLFDRIRRPADDESINELLMLRTPATAVAYTYIHAIKLCLLCFFFIHVSSAVGAVDSSIHPFNHQVPATSLAYNNSNNSIVVVAQIAVPSCCSWIDSVVCSFTHLLSSFSSIF
jgi:hypothetical protein